MSEDHSILTVLETLAETSDLPQRELARQTGLNLAKVNFVLRRLVEKGFVKLNRVRDNPHKLRYLYLLTPEGIAEKSRLTYRFLRRTLQEYGDVERRVQDNVESLAARGVKSVVLWGAGEIADLFLRVIERSGNGITILGVVDPSGRHPRSIHPSTLVGLSVDAAVVCDGDGVGIPAGMTIWRLE